MLIQRDVTESVLRRSKVYPVISVTGPRQSGKATLAKMLFPNHAYISLERPDAREQAEEDRGWTDLAELLEAGWSTFVRLGDGLALSPLSHGQGSPQPNAEIAEKGHFSTGTRHVESTAVASMRPAMA